MPSVHSRRRLDAQARRPASERGSTLVELVFATALALVVIGAVITALAHQGTHRRRNLDSALVINAIADVFARLRTVPFATLPSFDGAGFQVPDRLGNPGGLQPVPGDLDGLPGNIRVTVASPPGPFVLYRVEVSVEWLSVGMRRREFVVGEIGERK